jgi:hypothetical protein
LDFQPQGRTAMPSGLVLDHRTHVELGQSHQQLSVNGQRRHTLLFLPPHLRT